MPRYASARDGSWASWLLTLAVCGCLSSKVSAQPPEAVPPVMGGVPKAIPPLPAVPAATAPGNGAGGNEAPLDDEQLAQLSAQVNRLNGYAPYIQSGAELEKLRQVKLPLADEVTGYKVGDLITVGSLEIVNPKQAIRHYASVVMPFANANEQEDGALAKVKRDVAVRICSLVARIYEESVGDNARSLGALDWGIRSFEDDAAVVLLTYQRSLLIRRQAGIVLNAESPGQVKAVSVPGLAVEGVPAVGANKVTSIKLPGGVVTDSVSWPRQVSPRPDSLDEGAGKGLVSSTQSPVNLKAATTNPVLNPGTMEQVGAKDVDYRGIRRNVSWEQLRGGKLSPREALNVGELTLNDFWNYLSWGTHEWIDATLAHDNGLGHACAKLIWEEDPRLSGGQPSSEVLAKVPIHLRLWIADYLTSSGDPRCVPVLRSLLVQARQEADTTPRKRLKSSLPTYFAAVVRLSHYYQKQSKPDLAFESWRLVEDLFPEDGQWIPESLVERARIRFNQGKERESDELYARVPAYKQGWYTGIALMDHAQELMGRRRFAEARKVLQTPVEGPRSAQVQVSISGMLGLTYYLSGDDKESSRWCEKAISDYSRLREILPHEGTEASVDQAQEILDTIELWKASPLDVSCSEIILPGGTEAPEVQFIVRSRRPVKLNISSENPGLKIEYSGGTGETGSIYCDCPVKVRASPNSPIPIASKIRISSPAFEGFKIELPVSGN